MENFFIFRKNPKICLSIKFWAEWKMKEKSADFVAQNHTKCEVVKEQDERKGKQTENHTKSRKAQA